MSIGDDIKEVLADVGIGATILLDTGNIVAAFVKPKLNAQVTKPFIREFFMEFQLAYDTPINAGDVVCLDDGRIWMVMNRTPEIFEGQTFRFSAVFYKTNVAGVLYRPYAQERDNYRAQQGWEEIRNPCHALLTESRYGHELDDEAAVGPVSLAALELYVPRSFGLQKGDRYQVSETEYYQVESIRMRHFDNVDKIDVSEDHRGPVT